LSDLVGICEYLSLDKTCIIFSDTSANAKTKSGRQLKCKNDQKNACCYLCIYRTCCDISCQYLGGQPERGTDLKNASDDKLASCENNDDNADIVNDVVGVEKSLCSESLPHKGALDVFCFSCNTEMAWAKTQFTVDNWCGNKPSLAAKNNTAYDAVDVVDKVLPVTVLVCPKCGKIEFKADLTQKNTTRVVVEAEEMV